MDEFKMKSIQPTKYDCDPNSSLKKYGRKSARKSLKKNWFDFIDQLAWELQDDWDDHGNYEKLCNDIEEYNDWGDWTCE